MFSCLLPFVGSFRGKVDYEFQRTLKKESLPFVGVRNDRSDNSSIALTVGVVAEFNPISTSVLKDEKLGLVFAKQCDLETFRRR